MKTNNPYAFPLLETRDMVDAEPGMTLRDYFAAKAMQGILAVDAQLQAPAVKVADWAYELADAMLEERVKK